MQCLIEVQRVIEIAYADAGYIPPEIITQSDIVTAQLRYLRPVIGEEMIDALMAGSYSTLYDDYVEPALAHYVRVVVDAPSAPSTPKALVVARTFMRQLSDYLDDNASQYSEYEPSDNILKRVNLDGGFAQVL